MFGRTRAMGITRTARNPPRIQNMPPYPANYKENLLYARIYICCVSTIVCSYNQMYSIYIIIKLLKYIRTDSAGCTAMVPIAYLYRQ